MVPCGVCTVEDPEKHPPPLEVAGNNSEINLNVLYTFLEYLRTII